MIPPSVRMNFETSTTIILAVIFYIFHVCVSINTKVINEICPRIHVGGSVGEGDQQSLFIREKISASHLKEQTTTMSTCTAQGGGLVTLAFEPATRSPSVITVYNLPRPATALPEVPTSKKKKKKKKSKKGGGQLSTDKNQVNNNNKKSPSTNMAQPAAAPSRATGAILKEFLKDLVHFKVTLSEEDRKRMVAIVEDTIQNHVIKEMKAADQLFDLLFQNVYYAGSYYDGLRVGEANEYDLNIRLKLPFRAEEVIVIHNNVPVGFVQYKLTKTLEELLSRRPKWDVLMHLDKIMDDEHKYLSQGKLNRWLTSVFDRAFENIKASLLYPVNRSRSGPALTLNLTVNTTQLDIDLVPVVELSDFPGSVRQPAFFVGLPPHKKTCFVVPKPPPRHLANLAGSDHFFRVSIPDAERHLLDSKQSLKMLIKIFKVIRDMERWTFLCSYYVKTIFMWQAQQNLSDAGFWKEEKLGDLFKMMLREFIKVMSEKSLGHIFFPRYNLLAAVDPATITNCKGRLESILKLVENEPEKLYTVYNIPRRSKQP